MADEDVDSGRDQAMARLDRDQTAEASAEQNAGASLRTPPIA